MPNETGETHPEYPFPSVREAFPSEPAHPFLFFHPRDIGALRAKCRTGDAGLFQPVAPERIARKGAVQIGTGNTSSRAAGAVRLPVKAGERPRRVRTGRAPGMDDIA